MRQYEIGGIKETLSETSRRRLLLLLTWQQHFPSVTVSSRFLFGHSSYFSTPASKLASVEYFVLRSMRVGKMNTVGGNKNILEQ
jgi:hypothetical protein